MPRGAAPGYDPPARRADAAIVGCWLAIGGAVLGIGTDVRRIVLIGQYLRDPTLLGTASDADGPIALATVLGLLTMIAALVLVARWALLVRGNAALLGDARPPAASGPARAALAAVVLVVVAVLWTRFGLRADTPRSIRSADWLDALVQALLVLVAIGGLVAIPRISRRQLTAASDAGVRAAPREQPTQDEGGLRVRTVEEVRRSRENREEP